MLCSAIGIETPFKTPTEFSEQQPALCIAGHRPEAKGIDQIGKTPI
jgi:Icc-related predicted phosphoesterase